LAEAAEAAGTIATAASDGSLDVPGDGVPFVTATTIRRSDP
jgi:hypothetical protein